MDKKWIAPLLVFIVAAPLITGWFVYTASLRQDCMVANYLRSAGDVVLICGRP